MDAENVENTLFAAESTHEQREKVVSAYYYSISDGSNQGQEACSEPSDDESICLICEVLDAEKRSILDKQLALFLRVFMKRSPVPTPNSCAWASIAISHFVKTGGWPTLAELGLNLSN